MNLKLAPIVQGWVEESHTEGQKEGRVEGLQVALLRALQVRFSPEVPADLHQPVESQTDQATLDRWFDLALLVASTEQFRTVLRLESHRPDESKYLRG